MLAFETFKDVLNIDIKYSKAKKELAKLNLQYIIDFRRNENKKFDRDTILKWLIKTCK